MMSLGSSLFVLIFILVVILVCIILLSPVRLQFTAEHQERWNGSATVKFWWFHHELRKSNQNFLQKAEEMMQKTFSEGNTERSVQIYWKPVIDFVRRAFHIVTERLHLETLCVHCTIGWERADITAYSYGLFWSLVSAMPERWLKNSEIIYVPDFQQKRQDVLVQGIICCRVGQLIGMILALFRLTVQMMLEQNRKEQMEYEN